LIRIMIRASMGSIENNQGTSTHAVL